MAGSSTFILRATEKFPDCQSKHGTSCMVSYMPTYYVNIEVWVEAENALGKVSSESINFDPVDKGT
jgi:interleukin 6 signal transducer